MSNTSGITVERVVPFLHVADVRETLAFYERLGLVCRHVLPAPDGGIAWAWVEAASEGSGEGNGAAVMLARASGAIDAHQQAVLLYLYVRDVRGLREHLLQAGVKDAGTFAGAQGDGGAERVQKSVVFAVTSPPHMPAGELRVHDPDGYCLLVGQLR